ncbi:MAG: MBL fold metallo-hydrolase [Syntrophomonadaceae bacterium]
MFRTIDHHIKLLKTPQNGTSPYCNCTLIDGTVRVLIDASCGTELATKIRQQGLDILLLTHFHYDHVICAKDLGATQTWCNQIEIAANQSLEEFQQMYGFHMFEGQKIGTFLIDTFQLEPKHISRGLNDGEILDFGKVRLKVIHTPGHTPGHTSFFDEEKGILIGGDIDPWYGCLCSDLDDYLETINKCIALRPRLVISGHNGIVEEDVEKTFLGFRDRILRREERIIQSLDTPRTFEDLASLHTLIRVGKVFSPYQEFFNKHGVNNHLKRLIKMGRIRKDDDFYYRV